MEGPRSSCATEMDLFLVSAATACAAGGLGGCRLCCSNKGIVLLLWMDKKRQTFRVLLNLSFASNFSCRPTSTPLDSHQGQPLAGICLWWRSISFVWPLWQYLLENTGHTCTAIEMFDILIGIVQLKRHAMIWGTECWTAVSVDIPILIWYETTHVWWVAVMGGLSWPFGR